MPKIYTKKGDGGTTHLYDGTELLKSNTICCVIGEIDELSSRIGIIYSLIPEKINHNHGIKARTIITSVKKCQVIGCSVNETERISPERISICYFNISDILTSIQRLLQQINSILATNSDNESDIAYRNIKNLEEYIDFMSVDMPTLTKFILPGVTQCDAQVHICRTQTRKVERFLVQIKTDTALGENIYKYMNRLSDFFFILARWICQKENLVDRF